MNKNLNDLKIIVPDWRYLGFDSKYENFIIPDIEKRRITARLVLLQIARYKDTKIDILIHQIKENKYKSDKEIVSFLELKFPEILKWYFA